VTDILIDIQSICGSLRTVRVFWAIARFQWQQLLWCKLFNRAIYFVVATWLEISVLFWLIKLFQI